MKPKIITAAELGLSFQNLFGPLGTPKWVTGHWSAGVVDRDLKHAIELARQYHAQHARQGWGGIGYHFMVTRAGHILCLRPLALKGAHVGGWNSQNVGVLFCGGAPGHRGTLDPRQVDAYRWLLSNAHTTQMPRAHRSPVKLSKPTCGRRGHNDWSGHESNQCPGTFKHEILTARNR